MSKIKCHVFYGSRCSPETQTSPVFMQTVRQWWRSQTRLYRLPLLSTRPAAEAREGAVGAPAPPPPGRRKFFRRDSQEKLVGLSAPPAKKVYPQAEQESILGHFKLCQEDLEVELVVLDRLLEATTIKVVIFVRKKVHPRQNPGYAYCQRSLSQLQSITERRPVSNCMYTAWQQADSDVNDIRYCTVLCDSEPQPRPINHKHDGILVELSSNSTATSFPVTSP